MTKNFCSLDVSKKLIKLGIKIDSMIYWVKQKKDKTNHYELMFKNKEWFIQLNGNYDFILVCNCDYYPAPIANELYDILPLGTLISKGWCTEKSTVVFKDSIGYELNLSDSIANLLIKLKEKELNEEEM